MRRRIFQGLVLAALGLFAFDCALDVAGACDTTQSDVCHACFCGPHIAPQAAIASEIAPAAAPYLSYEPPAYAYHLPVSILRPPRLAA